MIIYRTHTLSHQPGVIRRRCKIIDQTSQQIGFRQVEQRVEHINARLVKLDEFIRIQFIHLRTDKKYVTTQHKRKFKHNLV